MKSLSLISIAQFVSIAFCQHSGEYILYDERTDGIDANAVCLNEYGTTAATIHSLEDNNKAWAVCQTEVSGAGGPYGGGHYCYVGLFRDDASTQNWYWKSDGSYASSTYSTYINWDGSQPGPSEKCVAFWNMPRWHDEWCEIDNHEKPVVCDKPACRVGNGGRLDVDMYTRGWQSNSAPYGTYASIKVDEVEVKVPTTGHEAMRGHNVVVLNQYSGEFIKGASFDTCDICGHAVTEEVKLFEYLQSIEEGRIVLITVNDEGSFQQSVLPKDTNSHKLLMAWGCDVEFYDFREPLIFATFAGAENPDWERCIRADSRDPGWLREIFTIPLICEDTLVDECLEEPCDANALCTDKEEGYDCTCKVGWVGDGDICEDVCTTDPCDTAATHMECNQDLLQTSGYACTCEHGFVGNGDDTCIDICTTDPCDPNALCEQDIYVDDGYSCECNQGYTGDGKTCSDVDECAEESDNCDENAQCSNTDGGFECECNDGFTGDGFTCADIDECSDGTHDCDENASCDNTAGSFNCECNDGFSGDGRDCHTYILVPEGMSFSTAQQYCYNEHGSSLATVITSDDYDAVLYVSNAGGITDGDLWVGLSDANDEGLWSWHDGTSCDYAPDDLCLNDNNWKDGQPRSAVDNCITRLSQEYGGMGGGYAEAVQQGRISGIRSWGYGGTYDGFNGLVIKQWTSDEQTNPREWGARLPGAWAGSCTAFDLDADDSINGYTVWAGERTDIVGDYVHGVEFRTRKGNSYRCINPNEDGHELEHSFDCGNCELTGFIMRVGDIIDKIQFEFSYSCMTNDCGSLDLAGSFGSFLSDEQCNIAKPFMCDMENSMVDVSCDTAPDTFNWDTLTEDGENIPELNWDPNNVELSIDVDPPHLAIRIHAELEYIGAVSADDQKSANFGFTYVLDFEDYNAHEDNIYNPGTCQNRRHESFLLEDETTLRDFKEWWYYSDHPNLNAEHLGSAHYLAYPPPHPHVGNWEISMKAGDDCHTVVYDGYFTWDDLRNCGRDEDGDGVKDGAPYTTVKYSNHENGRSYIDLEGTFYINAVSPYWFNKDYSYYRVYQLLSQPFILSVATSVEVLGSAGINVMTICVIAVYKEGTANNNNVKTGEDIFRLVVLTEAAEYLALSNANLFEYDGAYAGELSAVSDSVNGNCLGNKDYICSQLWEIRAENVVCSGKEVDPSADDQNTLNGGINFSGDYILSFDTGCIADHPDEAYCGTWLDDHEDIKDGVKLTATLSWHDYICDPILFEVQFNADMSFYKEDSDGNVDWLNALVQDDDGTTNHLYQVGTDIVYVEINSDFPSETYNIFDTTLLDVYICTFAPGTDYGDVTEYQNTGDTGCLSDNRDEEFDDKFHHIFSTTATITQSHSFDELDTDGLDDDDNAEIRFQFIVPNEVQRDTLYVHAFIEVTLVELETGRRLIERRLIRADMAEGTANQIGNEFGSIGITKNKPNDDQQPPQDNNNNKPDNNMPDNIPDNNIPPPQPQPPLDNVGNNSFVLSLNSPWIIAIGGLLGLILIFNIVMLCYINCGKEQRRVVSFSSARRSGYASVKHIDSSEFDDDESKAINVLSDDPSVSS